MNTIKKETIETEVYSVYGKPFLNKKDAEAYRDQVKEKLGYRFYLVHFGFDYTEGRGYFRHEIVAIKENKFGHIQKNAIIAYCIKNHGNPIRDFYGRAQDNWFFSPEPEKFEEIEDLDNFIAQKQTHYKRQYGHKFHGAIYCDEFGRFEDSLGNEINDGGKK